MSTELVKTEGYQKRIYAIIEQLKDVIHGISGMEIEDMDADEQLLTYGLDSMLLLKMARQIDENFEVEIPLDVFFTTLNTLQLVACHIVESSSVLLPEPVAGPAETPVDPAESAEVQAETAVDPPEVTAGPMEAAVLPEVTAGPVEAAGGIRDILKVFENQYDIMAGQNEVLSRFFQKSMI